MFSRYEANKSKCAYTHAAVRTSAHWAGHTRSCIIDIKWRAGYYGSLKIAGWTGVQVQ